MSGAATSMAKHSIEGRVVSRAGDAVVLAIPGTDYRLHLAVEAGVAADERGELRGSIEAEAKRVDVVGSGGKFVEPVIGRPRRVQGRIVGGDARLGAIVVDAGFGPIVCRLTDLRQGLGDFSTGQLVAFDVMRGARLVAVDH
ncbi:MAG: hypothetical protein AAGI54_15135 [Planctomycetota bacterium]